MIACLFVGLGEGYQIIISSHSPVFAGASPIEDMALVMREAGVDRVMFIFYRLYRHIGDGIVNKPVRPKH